MTASGGTRRLAIAAWAVGGVALALAEAIVRTGAYAVRSLRGEASATTWLAVGVVVAVFCYGEGYRGLQRRFAPHVVRRAFTYGAEASGCFAVMAAPLHAMSLVGDSRPATVRAWLGVTLIAAAVVAVRALPTHARGAVDAGVASALCWGLVALLAQTARAVAARRSLAS